MLSPSADLLVSKSSWLLVTIPLPLEPLPNQLESFLMALKPLKITLQKKEYLLKRFPKRKEEKIAMLLLSMEENSLTSVMKRLMRF